MLEVDNANCVLVEFVNEYNKLAVGYRIWFVEKDLIENDDHLDEVIKDEITIQILWPNCDVKSASTMKKIIKNFNKDDWSTHAVKVHSYGGIYYLHVLRLSYIDLLWKYICITSIENIRGK